MTTTPRSIRLKEDQLSKLRELGKKQDRSLHWLVVEAVDRYLETHYQK